MGLLFKVSQDCLQDCLGFAELICVLGGLLLRGALRPLARAHRSRTVGPGCTRRLCALTILGYFPRLGKPEATEEVLDQRGCQLTVAFPDVVRPGSGRVKVTLNCLMVTIAVTLAVEEERAPCELVVPRKASTIAHVTSRQWALGPKATLVTALVHKSRIYSGSCCVCWTTDVHDNPEVIARPETTNLWSLQKKEVSILQLGAHDFNHELESVSITKDHATVLVELPVPVWALVWGVKDRVFEKAFAHC